MNYEYLWSKNGNDPELENLETLLSEFRFIPGRSPTFENPVKEEQSWFSVKRMAWIFGFATPSFALALFGFWLFSANPAADIIVRNSKPSIGATETPTALDQELPISISTSGNEKKTEARNRKAAPSNVKTVYRSRKTRADSTASLVAMRLSKEEKYAYDRLMLALSIAGTKLKVVQDAVDGNTGKDLIRNTK